MWRKALQLAEFIDSFESGRFASVRNSLRSRPASWGCGELSQVHLCQGIDAVTATRSCFRRSARLHGEQPTEVAATPSRWCRGRVRRRWSYRRRDGSGRLRSRDRDRHHARAASRLSLRSLELPRSSPPDRVDRGAPALRWVPGSAAVPSRRPGSRWPLSPTNDLRRRARVSRGVRSARASLAATGDSHSHDLPPGARLIRDAPGRDRLRRGPSTPTAFRHPSGAPIPPSDPRKNEDAVGTRGGLRLNDLLPMERMAPWPHSRRTSSTIRPRGSSRSPSRSPRRSTRPRHLQHPHALQASPRTRPCVAPPNPRASTACCE